MVILKSICSFSKYSKKNDDILGPMFNDYRVSEFTTMLSRGSKPIDEASKGSLDLLASSFRTQKSLNSYSSHFPSREASCGVSTSRRAQTVSVSQILRRPINLLDDTTKMVSFTRDDNYPEIAKKTTITASFENQARSDGTLSSRPMFNMPKGNRYRNFVKLGGLTSLIMEEDISRGVRCMSIKASPLAERKYSPIFEHLCSKIEKLLELKSEQVMNIRKNYGNTSLGDLTVSCLFSGLKDAVGMVTETSELDPKTGIRIRTHTIDSMLKSLPSKNPGSGCPYSEAVLWLLLTNEVPTLQEVKELSLELCRRSEIPDHVFKVIDAFPPGSHPMTQFISAVSALQTESVFREAYFNRTYNKDTCWKLILDDSLDLLAKNLIVVGYIYRRCFIDPNTKGSDMKFDPELDYGSNLAKFLGHDSELFGDVMRLYVALHSDHEGGNVSAHASHLVGSALADPYFCFSAALCGLSGPLHGMANQECLFWIQNMLKELKGQEITVDTVTKFAQDTLARKQVIPGYGHAVLKITDPRHSAFMDFALRNFPDDPLVKLLDICLQAIPKVLEATGKVRNPNPNVDCSTGVILHHFNINHPEIFTALFGLSRADRKSVV